MISLGVMRMKFTIKEHTCLQKNFGRKIVFFASF